MNQGPYNPYNAPNPYGAPGPYMPPPGGPVGPSGYDYEFNEVENAVIAKAAFWAKLLGIFMIVSGVASLINCNVVAFAIDLAVGIPCVNQNRGCFDWNGSDYEVLIDDVTVVPAP